MNTDTHGWCAEPDNEVVGRSKLTLFRIGGGVAVANICRNHAIACFGLRDAGLFVDGIYTIGRILVNLKTQGGIYAISQPPHGVY